MEIDIKELAQITQQLLAEFTKANGDVLPLEKDCYWEMSSNEIYNPYQEPKELTLGQLSEDWEGLKRAVASNSIISYDLQRLGNILKALNSEYPV